MMKKGILVFLAACLLAGGILSAEAAEEKEEMGRMILENEKILLELDLTQGAAITRLYGKETEKEYLPRVAPLFSARVTNQIGVGGYKGLDESASTEMTVTAAGRTADGAEIVLEKAGLQYKASLSLPEGAARLTMGVEVVNGLEETVIVRLTMPQIEMVAVPGKSENRRAMIPNEIGSFGNYGSGSYGHGPAATGMPTAFNAMETAAVFDQESGQGIAFFPIGGRTGGDCALIQMQIQGTAIYGYWAAQIAASGTAGTPVLAISLLKGGWQEAIDQYAACNGINRDVGADIPAWLKESGAVYSTRREGTGGSYQCLPGTTDLSTRIHSFRELPVMLEEARTFGTDVLLLVDYYQKADLTGADIPEQWRDNANNPYWNKGDYMPRNDLGGEEALIDGIRAVHEQGGRVIVYVEPFIVFQYSEWAKAEGERLAARSSSGLPDSTYIMNYTMQPATKEWQDRVVEICQRLVGEYDVDGILLDSVGWQWNKIYFTNAERIFYSMQEYNKGLLEINARVREAIRAIKPDAVVMSESGSGPMIGANDGGFTADYCWNNATGNENIVLSPTKYAYPQANFFSSGTTLNSLNQVFAAGFSLSLCDYWAEDAEYIRQLVTLRREYADALVYGAPSFPETNKKNVGAYRYQGQENELLILVNAGNPSSKQEVALGGELAGSQWQYLLGGTGSLTADEDGGLEIRVPARTLAVLKRE